MHSVIKKDELDMIGVVNEHCKVKKWGEFASPINGIKNCPRKRMFQCSISEIDNLENKSIWSITNHELVVGGRRIIECR